jgi:osmoprotectant transport system substrate-binding protein
MAQPLSRRTARRAVVVGLLIALPLGGLAAIPAAFPMLSTTAGATPASSAAHKAAKPTIVIGSTNFEEQTIVANLYADVLQHAGYRVKVEPSLGTRAIVVPAIESGQIDLEPDYAGSLVNFLAGDNATLPQSKKLGPALRYLRAHLREHGVTVLAPAKALDTNVFAVTRATAKKYHLTTLASLKKAASKLVLGGPPECPTYEGCLKGLEKVYGLHFAAFKATDEAGPISVADLKNGAVQVVELFSSNGTVQSNHFVALKDTKHLEGATYVIPVIRLSVDKPRVRKVLDKLSKALTTAALSSLNLKVTTTKKQPATVARAWLRHKKLI